MSQGKRLLLYILLNILVSAGTTLAVLLIWNQTHPSSIFSGITLSQSQPNLVTATATLRCSQFTSAQTTPLPVNQELIAINNIFGTGSAANEIVLIQNKSTEKLSLTGWCLENKAGDYFIFPNLTLNPGSQVQVHSTSGINTVSDLYWDRDQAAWQEGDTAVLIDSQGIERAHFTIP